MTRILFERRPHIYLPEIAAYMDYLKAHHPDVKGFDSALLDDVDVNEYDIVWRFMGTDLSGEGAYIVHEYNSLSAPPFAKLKNQVKKCVNRRPDRRVFLNETVRDEFNFRGDIPHNIRDMGVAEGFFAQDPAPEFDFVYTGSLYRGGEVERLMEHFISEKGRKMTLLVVGAARQETIQCYGRHGNVQFTGAVRYEEVPKHMARGRYGLNILPLKYPFTHQTATKVLEYCALGLPVVSVEYEWMQRFMAERGGQAFFLAPDFGNLSLENIGKFDFKVPDVSDLRWDSVIGQSGIFDMLPKSHANP